MSLDRSQFPVFFAAVHGKDRSPFLWQERLLDRVLGGASWPRAITAPTGAGKTAAIDVHVFALACAAAQRQPLPPRRLSMVVARRVLVDDQYDHARYLRDLLIAPDDEVLGEVADALWGLRDPTGERREDDELVTGTSPLVTARLRGGEPPSRSWLDEPSAAAVICATPDMWGSRLLFRGYGAWPLAWPRAAGLLAFDSAVVVDEAHLSSQLLVTARRVGVLAEVAESKAIGVAPVQVVATTATPGDDDDDRVGVEETDIPTEPVLAPRLTRPKPVNLVSSADWAVTTPRSRAVVDLADAVVDLRTRLPDPAAPDEARTVGCFVNTVARAVAVTAALRDRHGLRVVMVCGQVRPHDLQPLRDSGLLGVDGNPAIDVLVSTQSLEVGVDLDLAGLVTELAASTALVQRAGRVNRRGTRKTGPITVLVPTTEIKAGARSGPYDDGELTTALAWLRERASDPAGLTPLAIGGSTVPRPAPRRVLHQRPEWADALHWARTSDDLAAEPELDLWLSEELDRRDELSLGLVVRRWIPADGVDARAMLAALPPRRHEIFPLPFTLGRDAVARAYGEGYDATTRTSTLQAFCVRGKEVEQISWRRRENAPRPEGPERLRGWDLTNVRPGDVVVVDAETALFTAPGDEANPSPPVVVPAGDDTTRHRAADVLEAEADLASSTPGRAVHRVEMRPPRSVFASDDEYEQRLARLRSLAQALEELDRDDEDVVDLERGVVARWLASEDGSMAQVVRELLTDEADARIRVEVQGDDDGITRLVVVDRRRAQADEDVRQEESPRRGRPPTLADHERDVAARARAVSTRLDLEQGLIDALEAAGAHHDKGKGDPRFQFRLGARADDPPLAKGRPMSARTRRRRSEQSGLPTGWRHEQRSVADAWPIIQDDVNRDLVARLIGTSHGHGRTGFTHAAGQLLPEPDDDVVDLFDEGRWDELIECTHRRYGVWGCAYLEAVLRAADGQISREGR